MAEKLKKSLDVGTRYRKAHRVEALAEASLQKDADNRKKQLSRTITQPRGLYEAMFDTYGPMIEDREGEDSAIDQAYDSLRASCSSDAQTCSFLADGQKIHADRVCDRKGGHAARGIADNHGQSSGTQRRNESPNQVEGRSDEDWVKSILRRPTGWGYAQRSQVTKYRTSLETSVTKLTMEVSKLTRQVAMFKRYRSCLQEEMDTLKGRMAEATKSQFYNKGQTAALQQELELLKIQGALTKEQAEQKQDDRERADDREQAELEREDIERADDREEAEQEQQDTVLGSIARLRVGHGDDAEAIADRPIVQEHSYDRTSVSAIQTREELEGLPGVSTQSSREAKTGSNPSSSSSFEKEPHAAGEHSRPPNLVKWPSTLYRSVSAIRKDVLEVAEEVASR